MHKKSLLLAALIFISTLPAYSFINSNLISCPDRSGGYLFHCAIAQNLELKGAQPYESDFFVSYTLTCNRGYAGPVPSKMELRLEKGTSFPMNFNSSVERIKVGTGYGPLTIFDTLPQQLYLRPLAECSLTFSSIEAVPSAATAQKLEQISATLKDINSNLAAKEKEAVTYYSNFISDAAGKEALYCLIKNYDDPIINSEELLKELKNLYFSQYSDTYVEGKYACPVVTKAADVAQQCETDPYSQRACAFYTLHKRAKEWMTTKMTELESFDSFAGSPFRESVSAAKAKLTAILSKLSPKGNET
jgi:hypothetical protein